MPALRNAPMRHSSHACQAPEALRHTWHAAWFLLTRFTLRPQSPLPPRLPRTQVCTAPATLSRLNQRASRPQARPRIRLPRPMHCATLVTRPSLHCACPGAHQIHSRSCSHAYLAPATAPRLPRRLQFITTCQARIAGAQDDQQICTAPSTAPRLPRCPHRTTNYHECLPPATATAHTPATHATLYHACHAAHAALGLTRPKTRSQPQARLPRLQSAPSCTLLLLMTQAHALQKPSRACDGGGIRRPGWRAAAEWGRGVLV